MGSRLVTRFNFISSNILSDEEVDQLLGIVRTSWIKVGANWVVGSTLIRATKLSSPVVPFLWGIFVFFTQRGQRIARSTKNR